MRATLAEVANVTLAELTTQTGHKPRDKKAEGKQIPQKRPHQPATESPMTTHADVIQNAQTPLKNVSLAASMEDARLQEIGKALGAGFEGLDARLADSAARVESAVAKIEPVFEVHEDLGIAMLCAGVGMVGGGVAGAVVASKVSPDGVVPSRLEVLEVSANCAIGGSIIGFAAGALGVKAARFATRFVAGFRAGRNEPKGG